MIKNTKITTPVTFFIFNRPETTKKVFEEIRKAEPEKLFVVADGPRTNAKEDESLCKQTREITENIDWDCEVVRDYAKENFGLRKRIITGLSRVFEQVDETIILEDDCLPNYSFFLFCQELLSKYKNENRIMMISGNNFLFNKLKIKESYYFTVFNHIWGWATWKRAWQFYDDEMKDWNEMKETDFLFNVLQDEDSAKYFRTIFQEVYEGKINSWGYRWLYSMWKRGGLSIAPQKNLVTNIGFGSGATNTKSRKHIISNLPREEMEFPLTHPVKIERNLDADLLETKALHRFRGREWIIRTIKKILRM